MLIGPNVAKGDGPPPQNSPVEPLPPQTGCCGCHRSSRGAEPGLRFHGAPCSARRPSPHEAIKAQAICIAIPSPMKRWFVNGIVLVAALLCMQMRAAAESTAEYNMRHRHSSSALFFEWVEHGVGGRQFVVLRFTASADQGAPKRAACTYAIIYSNAEGKYSELTLEHFSTDDETIKNLSVTPQSVSFEIYVGSSDPGGEARKFSFKASRQGLSSSNYTAQAIATWRSLLDETKLVNIVWKQIPAINLPFSTIKNFGDK